ncbi:MAG: thioesterase [Sphingobacteriales bacterium]|nr:MAG: thioesterase [Sphingobacteriales bacterium]
MEKVKIILPADPPDFECLITVRVSDINYGNHVGNDSLVSFLHEARVQFLTDMGYTEFDIEGVGLIQADLMVRYKNEAFLGDKLSCKIFFVNFSARSFDMICSITTERNHQNITIAAAKAGLVCYNYQTKSIAQLPAQFTNRFLKQQA